MNAKAVRAAAPAAVSDAVSGAVTDSVGAAPVAPGPVSAAPPTLLSAARAGQEVTLVGVQGEGPLHHRLAEMGLLPGVRLTVVRASQGPFIVLIKNTRLVLSRGLVEKVLVTSA